MLRPELPLDPRKRAIVVGASSGIGASLSRVLAHHGYLVALVARREALLAETCENINHAFSNGPVAIYFRHDVLDFEKTSDLFREIAGRLGGLDLLVYVAGQQYGVTEEDFDFEKDADTIRVNLLGALAWIDEAGHRFSRIGDGHIVAVSSIAGDRGRRHNPAYNASKAGLDTLLEGMRNRLSGLGVTVTTIKPGLVDTVKLAFAQKAFWVISADEAAEQIFQAISKKKQTAYIPGRWRLFALAIKHVPSVIFRRLNI